MLDGTAAMFTFRQGQMILNAFFAIDSVPPIHAPPPTLQLPLQAREQMLERIREAKSQILPRGAAVTREAHCRAELALLSFQLDEKELGDVVAAVGAVLLEARRDPKNWEPLVGASANELAQFLEAIEKLNS